MDEDLRRKELLKLRLVEVAKRRVPADVVDAVVEPVLDGINGADPALPLLRSALTALRLSIRQYYEGLADSPRLGQWQSTDAPLPAESLEEEELRTACTSALRELEEDSPAASRYLRQLAGGATTAEVAGRVKISPEVLYHRLFRGRDQLDRILVATGVRT